MSEAQFDLSQPANEPILDYTDGSVAKHALKKALRKMGSEEIEIPLIIGGRAVYTGNTVPCVVPHDHGHVLARVHLAGPDEVAQAVEAAATAFRVWSRIPWPERVSVFLRAAELLAGPWRARINAAAILGISKNVFQAEVDAACETIDFFRFNAHFTGRIYSEQPGSTVGIWDRLEWRPLEGFVFAVTPFNFASIMGNLPSAPAMMGNTVVWKPASNAVFTAYQMMALLVEAGLPPGVINFLPGPGRTVGEQVLRHRDLAGVHFTGSTPTFQRIWRTVGENVAGYRAYPRVVGETGGKDFVFAHPSADPEAVATALVRGAFEYQGQKCSAASRAYIPESLWPQIRDRVVADMATIAVGDPADFRTFVGAVIDEAAFDNIASYQALARSSDDVTVLAGGDADKTTGYFVQPTVVQTTDPRHRLMSEEIFGPLLTAYVYPDREYSSTLEVCNETSPYGLTGAIFARDRIAIHAAHQALRYAAGNFYINDKPTGAVVGQQPFGGSRQSGTNDKAGSMLNLLRWVSPRTIKETFVPPTDYRYPHMEAE